MGEEGGRFIIVGRPEALASYGQSERVQVGGQKAWGRIVWKEWNGRGAASFWWDVVSSLSFSKSVAALLFFRCEWLAQVPTSRRRPFYESIWRVFRVLRVLRVLLSAIDGKELDLCR